MDKLIKWWTKVNEFLAIILFISPFLVFFIFIGTIIYNFKYVLWQKYIIPYETYISILLSSLPIFLFIYFRHKYKVKFSIEPGQDWRLQGQEEYLMNEKLYFRDWKRIREDWDHDHCEFCWAKFSDIESDKEEILKSGYTDTEEKVWICTNCFEDFKTMFIWEVEDK